jgi:hypothetical protein
VYKPSLCNKVTNSYSTIRRKGNFFKANFIGTPAVTNLNNNLVLPDWGILLFKKQFAIALTFRFAVLIKQLFFNYNGYFLIHKNNLTRSLSKDYLCSTNLLPSSYFNYTFKKMIVLFRSNLFLKENLTP